MKKRDKQCGMILGTVLFMIAILGIIKYFNLTWVETNIEEAKVTINFLIPMAQDELQSHLSVESERDDSTQFRYSAKWLSPQIVEIHLSEENAIKGLKVRLCVNDAPTKWRGITKTEKIPIQFIAPIKVNEANTSTLIASNDSFMLTFNTPIKAKELSRYLSSEADFNVSPYKSEKHAEQTSFLLTPQKPLENGKKYQIIIKKGVKACSGMMLEEDVKIDVLVDQKPTLTQTYPGANDKWIGLYPKITFSTKQPITEAIAKINNETLKAELVDPHHGYFLLDKLLSPNTVYQMQIQLKAPSGERSEIYTIPYSTTSVNNDRAWLLISCSNEKCIKYYEGTTCVKTFVCGIGREIKTKDLGTYYLQGKSDVYENYVLKEGANYWLPLNDQMGIHGYTRTSEWQINEEKMQDIGGKTDGKNIILSDEDAGWLYEKVNAQTMVIIKK